MRIRDAVLLGAVQGLTEFLPISSSAHLALLRRFGGPDEDARAFEVALHLATGASLLVVMRRDALAPPRALLADVRRHGLQWRRYSRDARLALHLSLATLPAIVVGTLFRRQLDRWAERPPWIAASLLAGSLGMALAERREVESRGLEHAGAGAADALVVGIAQAAALAPGVSRSGATMAAGMLCGLDREGATRLSLLLALPVTIAAMAGTTPTALRLVRRVRPLPVVAGMVAAAATGLLSIGALRRVLNVRHLTPIIWYRCILAALLWLSERRR